MGGVNANERTEHGAEMGPRARSHMLLVTYWFAFVSLVCVCFCR